MLSCFTGLGMVKVLTQHVVRGDYWVPINCSLTINGGVTGLIAWLDHSCQKTEVGGKQEHAPCSRILLPTNPHDQKKYTNGPWSLIALKWAGGAKNLRV